MAEKICMGCMKKFDDRYNKCPFCGYDTCSQPKEPYHLAPGTILGGKYIVGKAVGYGGFSTTYIGYDYSIEKKVAIKEYLPSELATRSPGTTMVSIFSGDRADQFNGGIEKFVDEAKRLASFRGTPGITDVYDVLVENNTAYIVMEYLEGETLKAYLEREGKISADKAIEMMIPIIRTLSVVNEKGILHRDIAPDNIFLTLSGEVKLIDFGAARQATSTNHSKSLSVIVKPGYAPPEQYRSRGDQGPWTDVYGCAAVLYKMITGITPEDSMDRDTSDSLKDVSEYNLNITSNQENAIMNALNLEIEDRTPDMSVLEYELTTSDVVIRKKIKKKKIDFGRWPMWLKIAVPSVAGIVVIFGLLLLTGVINWKMLVPKSMIKTRVPNVVNQSVDNAEKILAETNMLIQIVDKVESDSIPKDAVLSQNIPYGTEVKEGMILEVVVSGGVGQVYMPDLTGLSKTEAENILKDMGLFVKTQTAESEIKKDYVCEQQCEEGKAVDKGSEIILTISTGTSSYDSKNNTKVPKVVGTEWNNARKLARENKIYIYKSDTQYSDTEKKAVVIKQDIKQKEKVTEGTELGVEVSLGINTTRVPDVVFKSFDDATALMNNSKIKVDVTYEESDIVAKDHVISQSIKAGTEVEVWTTVTLCVSEGSEKIDSSPRYDSTDGTTSETTSETSTESIKPTTERRTTEATTESSSETTSAPTTEISTRDSSEEDSETENETTTEENTVAPEEEKVSVPDLTGETLEQAKSILSENGLFVGDVEYRSRQYYTNGTILSQGISAGTTVKKSTNISLIVCNNDTITRYRYRDVLSYDEKRSETKNTPYGYEYYKTETKESYGNWGGWSGWSSNYVNSSDTCNVQEKDGAVFGRYDTYNSAGSWVSVNDKWQNDGSKRNEWYLPWDEVHQLDPFQWYEGATERWGFNSNGEIIYRNVSGTGEWSWSGTVYRYQTREKNTKNIYVYRKPVYGSWSSWSSIPVSSSSTRQVETVTEYVYEAY